MTISNSGLDLACRSPLEKACPGVQVRSSLRESKSIWITDITTWFNEKVDSLEKILRESWGESILWFSSNFQICRLMMIMSLKQWSKHQTSSKDDHFSNPLKRSGGRVLITFTPSVLKLSEFGFRIYVPMGFFFLIIKDL